jgi:plasmid segregation protein ParM
MAKMVFVGIDDGHDSIKLTLESGKSFIIPARVSLGQHMLCSIADDEEKDHIYKIDDNDFSVIDFNTQAAINYIDTRTQDYPYSKHNIALIYHALHKAGITGPVSIMTGLPVERFYINGQKNVQLIDKKIDNLLNSEVKNINDKVMLPTVAQHRVISQALAAYFDLLLDMNGNVNPDIEEISNDSKIAIVDIGGRTTDIISVDVGGSSVDLSKSATRDIGALYLKDAIKQRIMNEYHISHVSAAVLNRILEKGNFRHNGKIVDVQAIVKQEKSILTNKITALVNQVLDLDFNEYGIVAFIGGGSLLIKDELKELYADNENVVLTDDPQFANSRGMLKFNKYILK